MKQIICTLHRKNDKNQTSLNSSFICKRANCNSSSITNNYFDFVFSKKTINVYIYALTNSAFCCLPVSEWESPLQLQPPKEKIVCHFLFLCCLPDLVCAPSYASLFPIRLQPYTSFCPDTYISQGAYVF